MTLERILKAAVNSMITGHHAPHCYSAHVPGRGYINDGSKVYDREDYLRQLEQDARSEVENMDYAPAYADGQGYDQPKHGVLFANWNTLPRGLDDILERAGYAVEWSDEWTTCEGCQKALRTSPDSYCWTPAYVESDNEMLCKACYADEHPVGTCDKCGAQGEVETVTIQTAERSFSSPAEYEGQDLCEKCRAEGPDEAHYTDDRGD